MNPLRTLIDAGLTLQADGDRLIVSPASLLDDTLRNLIRANRVELLAAVRDVEVTFSNLVDAIRACCAVRGDDAANVEALIREVPDYDTEAQRDLIEHFNEQTAIWRAASGMAS